MSNNLTFFIPYHTGYAHAELIHSFSSYADVHLFIYKWNPARQRIEEHFNGNEKIHLHQFNVETLLEQCRENHEKKLVVILTASINYLFGQLQLRFFRILQKFIPTLIDIYPVGHCMYGCQSCAYAYTHRIPITFTNFIRRRNENLILEKDFEILICPSYSFEDSPSSFLSNSEIVDYLGTLNCSHAIKFHPLAYESFESEIHPFLSLTDLEKIHVEKLLSQSKSILPSHYTNTLKLIEHARVVICDSNSSIPFETLYFTSKKFIFVYETANDFDEQDDRQEYFHQFDNVEKLKDLIEKYFHQQLETKTENSHDFFLEKYDEPDGDEIEYLAQVRDWISTEVEENENIFNVEKVKQTIEKEFQSNRTPMTLYALGDLTMSQVVDEFFNADHDVFQTLQENVNEL